MRNQRWRPVTNAAFPWISDPTLPPITSDPKTKLQSVKRATHWKKFHRNISTCSPPFQQNSQSTDAKFHSNSNSIPGKFKLSQATRHVCSCLAGPNVRMLRHITRLTGLGGPTGRRVHWFELARDKHFMPQICIFTKHKMNRADKLGIFHSSNGLLIKNSTNVQWNNAPLRHRSESVHFIWLTFRPPVGVGAAAHFSLRAQS